MPRSSGTRHGNGSGWGGAAKGPSTAKKAEIASPFEAGNTQSVDDPARGEKIAAGIRSAKAGKEFLEAHLLPKALTYLHRALESDEQALTASMKILDKAVANAQADTNLNVNVDPRKLELEARRELFRKLPGHLVQQIAEALESEEEEPEG